MLFARNQPAEQRRLSMLWGALFLWILLPLARPALGQTAAASNSTFAAPSFGTNALPQMEVAQAIMVTVELDFGPKIPSVAEALREIERRHQPDDRVGRTFAILDAYGQPTADGKLHLSMHVSSEKPGEGALVFRKTGQVLWRSRIVPKAGAPASRFTGQNLTILLDNGKGKSLTVDGSSNPRTILEAYVRELAVPVHEVWPEDAEREVTFLYSACGCPVKVLARRTGDRTARVKDLPVIFPDDPAVVKLIDRLMGW